MSRRKTKSSPGPYLLQATLLAERIPADRPFPYTLPAIRNLETLSFHAKVTFFIGENGSGKSTLLEALSVGSGLNPEGGSRNFDFATRASHSRLHEAMRLSRAPRLAADSYFLRAETFYNVASEIERLGVIGAYGGQSLHDQTHGESFFALFKYRFKDNGLYLMDEPEAALSPSRQLQFLALLHNYCQRGCQFVIATHSPIIMAYPDAVIYVFDEKGIREVPYTETEHYRVTRGFLNNPQRSMAVLFADEEPE
jgi:predicted ATPase